MIALVSEYGKNIIRILCRKLNDINATYEFIDIGLMVKIKIEGEVFTVFVADFLLNSLVATKISLPTNDASILNLMYDLICELDTKLLSVQGYKKSILEKDMEAPTGIKVSQVVDYVGDEETDAENICTAILNIGSLLLSFNKTVEKRMNNIKAQQQKGCYIATAVYGSYDCPQVWTLRRYRDYTLAETWYGRALIRTYYAISPTLVKWFGHTEWFKKMWQGRLDRMVADLQDKGFESTPYEDKKW